ncbi:MAG: hypothetical protein AB7O50_08425 [Pseudolabrys sp.]
MADRQPPRSLAQRSAAALGPHAQLAGLVLLAAMPILIVAALVPRPAVLPVLSLAAMATAAAIAAVAWWRKAPRQVARVTSWDLAGALVLIGCAAAILTETEPLLELFGQRTKP